MTDGRLERGKAIAEARQVREAPDGTWLVLSQSRSKTRYHVDSSQQTCTCPDYEAWELPCKHIFAVRMFLGLPAQKEPKKRHEVSYMPRPTYQQDWAAYNKAQINERKHFEVLLHDLCSGVTTPAAKNPELGGRPRLPLADVIYAATTKVYTTMSARRASTDIEECAEKHFIDRAPHANSLSRYLLTPELTPILNELIEKSALPLSAVETQFAADGTGFATATYARWFDHKYGRDRTEQRWIKLHAMIGTKTNIVTAVRVTEGHVHDATQLPDLLHSTAKGFDMKEVSADKGYLSSVNLMAIEAHGATPYIPFKSNSTLGSHSVSAWQKMWHLFWYRRSEFLEHYHRRSNVEATFSMMKRKFGGSVRSKKYESQVNEVLCKVLAHNIVVLIHEMYELGIDPNFA